MNGGQPFFVIPPPPPPPTPAERDEYLRKREGTVKGALRHLRDAQVSMREVCSFISDERSTHTRQSIAITIDDLETELARLGRPT